MTVVLKPAAIAISSAIAYQAGLGVGLLVESLGTEAAVAAALVGDGALTLTLGWALRCNDCSSGGSTISVSCGAG